MINLQVLEEMKNQRLQFQQALNVLENEVQNKKDELEKKEVEFQRRMVDRDLDYSAILGTFPGWNSYEGVSFSCELKDFLQAVDDHCVSLKEELRRQEETRANAQKAYKSTISKKQQAIADLIKKNNALKVQEAVLYDDKCAAEWRSLQQKLENWVKKSFKNASILNKMTFSSLFGLPDVPSEEVLEQSSHTRRAYIQSSIIRFIFDNLFGRHFVQAQDNQFAQHLARMAHQVKIQGKQKPNPKSILFLT